MEWAKPEHPKLEVNRAGKLLITPDAAWQDPDGFEHALKVINNWRASHNYPLNTFKVGLYEKSALIDEKRIVAQRIKRLSSIYLKLTRFKTMQLTQMQDIGGCRAILSTTDQVRALVEKYKNSDLKHKLHHVDDYII